MFNHWKRQMCQGFGQEKGVGAFICDWRYNRKRRPSNISKSFIYLFFYIKQLVKEVFLIKGRRSKKNTGRCVLSNAKEGRHNTQLSTSSDFLRRNAQEEKGKGRETAQKTTARSERERREKKTVNRWWLENWWAAGQWKRGRYWSDERGQYDLFRRIKYK